MKTFLGIILAAMVGTGCYTQVKSSGDYWGYTGKHEREKVQVVPNQQDTTTYLDSTAYTDDMRGRDDEGYSYDNYTYDDNYYSTPNWNYYPAPYVGFSVGFGWHRPWWNFGYNSYYPYTGSYDPYWDWYYQPGFFSYGCIAPVYPFYPYYHSFYHPYYGEHFGSFHHGFSGGGRLSNSGVRTGRIGGGENRGRGNTTIGSGTTRSSGSTTTDNFGRGVRSTSPGTSQPTTIDRSTQTRQVGGATQEATRTENNTATSTPARSDNNAAPARSNDNSSSTRSNNNAAPARSNDNAAPARSNENAAPAKSSSSGRGGGRSDNFMSAPRNNPRLVPQSNRSSGRVAQGSMRRGRNNYPSVAPRSIAGSQGSYSRGGSHSSNGGGYRSSDGGGSYHSGGGGGSRSGGGGGRRER